MNTAKRRSERKGKAPERLIDMQSMAIEDATVTKKTLRLQDATTNAAAASNDSYEIVGEDDNALLIVKKVNQGDHYSEAQSSDAWKDLKDKFDEDRYKAEREDALNKYSSYLENIDDEDIDDLDDLFVDPTEATYANSTKEEKRNFFAVLKASDGMDNKQRCQNGFDNLTLYVRIRVGTLGRANSYAVFAQDPVTEKWVTIFYFEERVGSIKRWVKGRHGAPGSLEYTIGGDSANLTMALGETVDHCTDANNNVLFRVKRVDVKVESVDDIKREAAKNEKVRELAMEKLEQRRAIGRSGLAKGEEQKYYKVTKKNDHKNEYGERGVKSVQDLIRGPDGVGKKKGTGDIGIRHLHIRGTDGRGLMISTSCLPKHVDGEVEITTAKGTFVVTRITVETYEKLTVRKKKAAPKKVTKKKVAKKSTVHKKKVTKKKTVRRKKK